MNHSIATIAYDGYMYWWVCTCRSYGPTEDSHAAALNSFQAHKKAAA